MATHIYQEPVARLLTFGEAEYSRPRAERQSWGVRPLTRLRIRHRMTRRQSITKSLILSASA